MPALEVCLLALITATASAPLQAQPAAGPFGRVAELTRRRADAEALAALSRLPSRVRRSAKGRYLRGRLLERLGRHADAAAAYPAGPDAASLPEDVRIDARRRRGTALARSGRCEAARAVLEPLRDEPLAQARRAECALAAGLLPAAVEELRAVVQRRAPAVDLFAARFELAEALTRSGQREEAVSVLRDLLVNRVEHPQAPRALSALEALSELPVEWSFAERMVRAERLYDVRRYDDALAELAAAGRPRARTELSDWLHLKGMCLYRERHHYAEAARVLAESARHAGAHAADDRFHAARALSRADHDLRAARAYRRFAAHDPGHRLAPEALYLAAWLELRHGVARGERDMTRFLQSPQARRGPNLARQATWQLGLRAFERGRFRRAAQWFERYADSGESPLVRARGLYWLGRAWQRLGSRGRAIAAYRQALYVEPLHWYALLARQRLSALGEEATPFPEPPREGPAPSPSVTLPEEVRFYAALGLRRDALEALRRRESALRQSVGLSGVVAAYRQLGEASRPLHLVGGAATVRDEHRPGPADLWRWEAAYPRPWPRRVAVAGASVGLSPAHLYAVMRQESGFDPDAVSYADAIGLMQLLPQTAERVADGLHLELRREMLFEPAVNIRLGATYVGGLARRFGIPLAFAAFNAGGHNVQRWLEQRGRTELDLFVERIPFQQTRNYVRRVTTHLAHYLYLEDPERGWPLELPTHVEP